LRRVRGLHAVPSGQVDAARPVAEQPQGGPAGERTVSGHEYAHVAEAGESFGRPVGVVLDVVDLTLEPGLDPRVERSFRFGPEITGEPALQQGADEAEQHRSLLSWDRLGQFG